MSIKTRECSVRDLRRKVAAGIRQYLSSNDRILICCETIFKEGIGLGVPRGLCAYVVTQNCLISSNYWRKTEYLTGADSMLLVDIISVQEKSDKFGYSVTAHRHGSAAIVCSFGSQQASRKFASILREAIEKAKTAHVAAPLDSPGSVEERLRTLTQLHRDGLVSDTEFQQKRKEILGQL